MAQKNATPTRAQAEVLRKNGKDPSVWVITKEFPGSLIIYNRAEDKWDHIYK